MYMKYRKCPQRRWMLKGSDESVATYNREKLNKAVSRAGGFTTGRWAGRAFSKAFSGSNVHLSREEAAMSQGARRQRGEHKTRPGQGWRGDRPPVRGRDAALCGGLSGVLALRSAVCRHSKRGWCEPPRYLRGRCPFYRWVSSSRR